MQLMTWMVARLGSRFALLFEPGRRRVMHSALGRFLDQPLDLKVGLVEPDGTERVLPFTQQHGQLLYNCEQFERLNSITFRGFSEKYGLRFEFNVHSVFYPQDEALCIMPAFYVEMRVNPVVGALRGKPPVGPTPDKVKLFVRLDRRDTQIQASDGSGGRIDLNYKVSLTPQLDDPDITSTIPLDDRVVSVRERLQSLNPNCKVDADGKGLSLELPVTEVGSGTKWRLVWGAFCGDPILDITRKGKTEAARFRYLQLWTGIDSVMEEAIRFRDDRLAHSRRFEKLVDQASLLMSQRHLLNQTFQCFLANTFWCDTAPPISTDEDPNATHGATHGTDWFSVWDGSGLVMGAVDVEYPHTLFYLSIWPYLLGVQFEQWADYERLHDRSGGSFLMHDLGQGLRVGAAGSPRDVPVEANADFLLMLQAYARWTGDLAPVKRHGDLIDRLARYLLWTDRDNSGFPSEGVGRNGDGSLATLGSARKQTHLAVKRVAALQAAADLLRIVGRAPSAEKCTKAVETDPGKIEARAWLGDHYVVYLDRSVAGVSDGWSGRSGGEMEMAGWDAYSIQTSNGLLLPAVCGQPILLDPERISADLLSATRETLGSYGCGVTSQDPENVCVSQNLWRDLMARYVGASMLPIAPRYWDLQVMSNMFQQSLGFADSYVMHERSFHPRGIVSLGFLLAGPRIIIDKLAAGGARISVEPDRELPQRWPLLPLGDWRAGKIPVCVVDAKGHVTIECEIDPVIIHGDAAPTEVIG